MQVLQRSDGTVVGDERRRAPDVPQDAGLRRTGEVCDAGSHGIDVCDVLLGHQVGRQAGDVRARHARAAQGLCGCGGLDAHALDVDARGKDVDKLTKVAEGGAAVGGLVDGADGDGTASRGGAVVLSVNVLIASGHHGDDACRTEGVDGLVDGVGAPATQGHVHDRLAREPVCPGRLSHCLMPLARRAATAREGVQEGAGGSPGMTCVRAYQSSCRR